MINLTSTYLNSLIFHFISEFLQIDFSDKLLVRAALGYQRTVDLFTGKERINHIKKTNSVNVEFGPIISSKDKEKLIEKLSNSILREEVFFFHSH